MEQRILLTPGPLSTSSRVKGVMQYDLGTRDQEYQGIVEEVRTKLLDLAHADVANYTCVLLQGSGTYGVESVLTSTVNKNQKILILANGSYGDRMEEICQKAQVAYEKVSYPMTETLPLSEIGQEISRDDITHVAYVHCETTAGVMNDIDAIQNLIHKYHKISIVDAMSSFASIDMSIDQLDIDYLITSSNKCLHGVPGIAIVFAKKRLLDHCKNICPSLALDLYDQYRTMENPAGSFRFTSPTHVILALREAIDELVEAGGIPVRSKRYATLQNEIRQAMLAQGFETLIDQNVQSYVITTYLVPAHLDFSAFYEYFKANGFLLYSGKLPGIDAFRIGNIGHISDEDLAHFKEVLKNYKD